MPPCAGSRKCPMLTSHTRTQMPAITLDRNSPNSSSFFFRGVISSMLSASVSRISPIAVFEPVPTTTARARPTVMTVPLNRMHVLSWYTALTDVVASTDLTTLSLSPVRIAWSARSWCDITLTMRRSAGTLAPTDTSTTSPGTKSVAGRMTSLPLRRHVATSAS